MIRSIIENIYEHFIIHQCRHIPKHVALIQDGNRRYAEKLGLSTSFGHRAGAERSEQVMDWAHELGIRYITLYTFSTENFKRSDDEIAELFELFKNMLLRIKEDERIHKYGIRIQIIGERDLLPDDLLELVNNAETLTAHYDNYFINIALAYGGRNEIVQASKRILKAVENNDLKYSEITPKLLEEYLYSNVTLPPVDLIIRTGNNCRTSNFLPWLANGHESAVYFCAPYWPQFRKLDLIRAVRLYSQRVEQSIPKPVST